MCREQKLLLGSRGAGIVRGWTEVMQAEMIWGEEQLSGPPALETEELKCSY